jgi:hypothetical protein
MNWDAIGAIAEGLGAVGVIVSLLYVARQVGASTRASAVESKLASTRSYTDFLTELVRSPELNELFLRGRKDLGSLSPEEYIRFSNLSLISFSYFSAGYFQLSRGTLDEDDWFENLAVIQFWLRGPGCQQWWDQVGRNFFGPRFVEFIDAEMAKSDAA